MLNLRKTNTVYYILMILLLGCAGFLLLYHVTQQIVFAFDEGRHGVNAYEMLQSGNWIMNTVQGQPDYYNLKPPLSMWAIMLGYKIFGFKIFGFRAQSLAANFLLFVVVAFWTKRNKGKLVSLVALAFMVANTVYFERTSDADDLYWLLTTIAFFFMLNSQKDTRYLYGTAFFFGLAFLDKSYHSLLIPVICFLYVLLTGQLKRLKIKDYIILIGLGLLPIVPWGIARYSQDGFEFLQKTFTVDVVNRVNDTTSTPWYYYLQNLLENPVSMIALLFGGSALIHSFIKLRKLSAIQIGLLLWITVPLVAFTLVRFKLHQYTLLIYSGIAVAGACGVQYWFIVLKKVVFKRVLAVLLALAMLVTLGLNFNYILHREPLTTYQTNIQKMFDRERDHGLHVYIQAGTLDNPDAPNWNIDKLLVAQLYGDVTCLNGGLNAFEKDTDNAVLIVDKNAVDASLWQNYPIRYDSFYLTVVSNNTQK